MIYLNNNNFWAWNTDRFVWDAISIFFYFHYFNSLKAIINFIYLRMYVDDIWTLIHSVWHALVDSVARLTYQWDYNCSEISTGTFEGSFFLSAMYFLRTLQKLSLFNFFFFFFLYIVVNFLWCSLNIAVFLISLLLVGIICFTW